MKDLRSRIIRLAYENTKLRSSLLQILKEAEEESYKESRFKEGPEGSRDFDVWLSEQPKEVQEEWRANTEKYKDKFKKERS